MGNPPAWEYAGEHWVAGAGFAWDAQGVVDAYRRKLPEFRPAPTVTLMT
jgi:hypothetical protein